MKHLKVAEGVCLLRKKLKRRNNKSSRSFKTKFNKSMIRLGLDHGKLEGKLSISGIF